MYVDDMITGVETSTQADKLYKEAKTLFQSPSMNLREWTANFSEFLQNIPECDGTSAKTMKVQGTFCILTADTIFSNGSHNLSSKVITIAVCQQKLRPIGSLFPSHTECKAVHYETVQTRKKLG